MPLAKGLRQVSPVFSINLKCLNFVTNGSRIVCFDCPMPKYIQFTTLRQRKVGNPHNQQAGTKETFGIFPGIITTVINQLSK